jgi:hypothetical protein
MTQNVVPFPIHISDFVNAEEWTFAKTMPKWPHEYLVRDRVDKELFLQMVRRIQGTGTKDISTRRPSPILTKTAYPTGPWVRLSGKRLSSTDARKKIRTKSA